MRSFVATAFLFAAAVAFAPEARAHCQVPCGIYDDELRVAALAEDITTIEKCMRKIDELSVDPAANMNQLVRWVNTKEFHAEDIMDTVAAYFMAQRLAPVADDGGEAYEEYVLRLTLLHEIMYRAMKAKQTTDLEHVEALRSLLGEFEAAYFGHDVAD
jgi:nickel superoxide dismutase